MAGRGKSATLPAWMTQSTINQPNGNLDSNNTFNESVPQNIIENKNDHANGHHLNDRNVDNRGSLVERSRRSSRSKDRTNRRSKSRSRSRERNKRDRSKRSPSNEPSDNWKGKRKNKMSNFDIPPEYGVEPLGVGIVSSSANTLKFPDELVSNVLQRYTGLVNSSKTNSYNLLQTQNARRLYVGGITADTIETDLSKFFVDTIRNNVYSSELDLNDPVIQVYINREKCFAFVELRSVELTTACCSLDGIKFTNRNDVTVTLRIRRPNDFKPELLQGISLATTPTVDLHKLGMVSAVVPQESVERIFVGGLPYHLTDDNVKELLSVFGPLKSFHLVRDAGSVTSKGYGFCEYYDNSTAQVAITGLNGMAIADKTLTVKFATQPGQAAPPQMFNMATMSHMPQMGVSAPYPVESLNRSGFAPLSLMSLQMTPPTRVLLLSNMITSNELNDGNFFNA